jgi:hypothetical protein
VMDPSLPAVQRFMTLAREIWGRTVATHTPEQLDELDRQIERNRAIRAGMFGNQVRPAARKGNTATGD